jgi:hypothetical protein
MDSENIIIIRYNNKQENLASLLKNNMICKSYYNKFIYNYNLEDTSEILFI